MPSTWTGKQRVFDPNLPQVKATWAAVFTVGVAVCTIPVPFVYASLKKSSAYMALIYACAVWNGATYYIDVFRQKSGGGEIPVKAKSLEENICLYVTKADQAHKGR